MMQPTRNKVDLISRTCSARLIVGVMLLPLMGDINSVHYFLWLTSQVINGLLYGWPITLILLVFIGVASSYQFPFKPSRFSVKYLLVFLPLLLSLVLLVWGALMAHHGNGKAPAWPANVVGLLSLLHILAVALVMRLMKGYRWFAASVLLFELWIAFFCNLIAAMSVSNVWM